MRLHRLRITSFAAIGNVDVEFGPGLNVLYGPNDLGKSTVVAAIRLGLLLPHNSTHCEQYVGWTGTGDPSVEVTFESEAQRIWRRENWRSVEQHDVITRGEMTERRVQLCVREHVARTRNLTAARYEAHPRKTGRADHVFCFHSAS